MQLPLAPVCGRGFFLGASPKPHWRPGVARREALSAQEGAAGGGGWSCCFCSTFAVLVLRFKVRISARVTVACRGTSWPSLPLGLVGLACCAAAAPAGPCLDTGASHCACAIVVLQAACCGCPLRLHAGASVVHCRLSGALQCHPTLPASWQLHPARCIGAIAEFGTARAPRRLSAGQLTRASGRDPAQLATPAAAVSFPKGRRAQHVTSCCLKFAPHAEQAESSSGALGSTGAGRLRCGCAAAATGRRSSPLPT